jgi:hypothetical protein
MDGASTDAETPDAEIPDAADGSSPPLPFFFGRPSPVIDILVTPGSMGAPFLSSDGLRLYFSYPGAPYVATRATVSDHFQTPIAVIVANLGAFTSVQSPRYSSDELEMFAGVDATGSGTYGIYRASRNLVGEPFGDLVPIATVNIGTLNIRPSLSSDGSELFFASDGAIVRSRRVGGVFQTPEAIVFTTTGGINDSSPFLADDGVTLFFSRSLSATDVRIMQARRADRSSVLFDDVVELPEPLNAPGQLTALPFVSEETNEIFFVSDRPWSPGPNALWRAQLCRTAACVDAEPTVNCGASAMQSPDGRHCYIPVASPLDWLGAKAACETMSVGSSGQVGHLVTVHSDEEVAMWSSSFADFDRVWTAGNDIGMECNVMVPGCSFRWADETGTAFEPFVAEAGTWIWHPMEPDNGGTTPEHDCLAMLRAPAASSENAQDENCATPHSYVCEVELWPWW